MALPFALFLLPSRIPSALWHWKRKLKSNDFSYTRVRSEAERVTITLSLESAVCHLQLTRLSGGQKVRITICYMHLVPPKE